MTINAVYRADAIGNDLATAFPYGFKIFAATDLRVIVRVIATGAQTVLTYPTHFTVSGVGDKDGGNVTLVDVDGAWQNAVDGSLKSTYAIAIRRVVDVLQETSIRNQGGFKAAVHEDEFDYLTMIDQQQEDALSRSPKLPESYDPDDFSMDLPAPVANGAIGYNASGNGFAIITSLSGAATTAFTQTLLDDANTEAFLDTLTASLSAETSPAVDDRLILSDVSAGTWDYIELQNALKVVGALTQDTNPDESADYLLSYDNSAGAAKRVLIADMIIGEQCGRLSLTSALPIPTTDVTAAATVYWTPYKGEILRIYDGTRMVPYASAELSVALDSNAGHAGYQQSGKNFDIFAINDAGTLRIGTGPAWSTDTARGTGAGTTEIEVKNGLVTNKVTIEIRFGSSAGNTVSVSANRATYLGTMRASADGQCEDSISKRFLWNNYNRVERPMRVTDTTDNWSYSTATLRQVRATATNQVDYVVGLSEDPVRATATNLAGHDTIGGAVIAGVGVDSTTVNSAAIFSIGVSQVANQTGWSNAQYRGFPGVGKHTLVWLEKSNGTGTGTMYGDAGGTNLQSGLFAAVMA